MFSLIRRISNSVIPRPDRPWEEDPTSNAPNTRRKRRLSSIERDVVMSTASEVASPTTPAAVATTADAGTSSPSTPQSDVDDDGERKAKKLRSEKTLLDVNDGDEIAQFLEIPVEAKKDEVREGSVMIQVTQGVKEVGLEDKDKEEVPEVKASEEEVEAAVPGTETDAEVGVETKSEDKPEEKEEKVKKGEEEETKPESVPLPTETDGELDEFLSSTTTIIIDNESAPEPLFNGVAKSKAQTQTEILDVSNGEKSSPRKPTTWASPKKQQTVTN